LARVEYCQREIADDPGQTFFASLKPGCGDQLRIRNIGVVCWLELGRADQLGSIVDPAVQRDQKVEMASKQLRPIIRPSSGAAEMSTVVGEELRACGEIWRLPRENGSTDLVRRTAPICADCPTECAHPAAPKVGRPISSTRTWRTPGRRRQFRLFRLRQPGSTSLQAYAILFWPFPSSSERFAPRSDDKAGVIYAESALASNWLFAAKVPER